MPWLFSVLDQPAVVLAVSISLAALIAATVSYYAGPGKVVEIKVCTADGDTPHH